MDLEQDVGRDKCLLGHNRGLNVWVKGRHCHIGGQCIVLGLYTSMDRLFKYVN